MSCNKLILTKQQENDYTSSESVRAKRFRSNMEMVLNGAESQSIKDYKLVFVPMIFAKHYYMISIDLVTCDVVVIDNSGVENVDFLSKYQDRPEKMIIALSAYLHTVGHTSATKILKSTPVRMQFPWRTLLNSVDCGVFLMRHLETYKGTNVKDWECGLSNEKNEKGEWSSRQQTELNDLRHKYVSKILLSEINTSKHVVECEVQMFGNLTDTYKKKLESTAMTRIMQRLGSV